MRKDRGFVILAQNNADTDYILCAEVLARSIKRVMPNESVTLLSDRYGVTEYSRMSAMSQETIFDHAYSLPFADVAEQDHWKLANDWQVYAASPYEHTIKLEADMFIPQDISWWFDILKDRDLVVASTIRDHANQISKTRFYRKYIDACLLPDTYNAITYFRKSETAEKFYETVKNIFENWHEYREIYSLDSLSQATTDEVYAIATAIIGEEHVLMPTFTEMSMIHMKNMIIGNNLEDWTNELTYELTEHNFKIETIPQLYPVHYHVKTFAKTLLKELTDE